MLADCVNSSSIPTSQRFLGIWGNSGDLGSSGYFGEIQCNSVVSCMSNFQWSLTCPISQELILRSPTSILLISCDACSGSIATLSCLFQKNPRVRKIRVRNSGAGNGCANFMDTWKKCVLSAGKPMSIKFPVFWGGVGGGGGSADFIFMGARIFLIVLWGIARAICCKMGYRTDVPV